MHKKSRNRPTDHEIVGWAAKNARQPGLFQRPARAGWEEIHAFRIVEGVVVVMASDEN
jgi:hypothetical protein